MTYSGARTRSRWILECRASEKVLFRGGMHHGGLRIRVSRLVNALCLVSAAGAATYSGPAICLESILPYPSKRSLVGRSRLAYGSSGSSAPALCPYSRPQVVHEAFYDPEADTVYHRTPRCTHIRPERTI